MGDLSVGGDDKKKKASSSRRKRRKPMQEQRFSNYLLFGFQSTVCLGVFLACYAIVLLTLWPLLTAQEPEYIPEETAADYIHHVHVPPTLKEALGNEKVGEMAGAVKKKLQQLRRGRGVTDAELLQQTIQEYQLVQKEKEAQKQKKLRLQELQAKNKNLIAGDHRNGFIVLGMHRSGTSMLSGLLHTGCGYTVGGPLIGSAFDNEKGFFERIDIVLQNDEFMNKQGVYWSANAINYDFQRALDDKESGEVDFKEHGETGLAFLNDSANAPWLQKDPRMCITLKTWLKLMDNEPAVVFTYRHPLEVAMSLKKRERNFPLEKGLRLWIVYNMRAIENSKGLCIVYSSNEAVLADPLNEVQRISDEMTTKCDVPMPPHRLQQEDVDKFIDPALQHNKKERAAEEQEKKVLRELNNGKCKVYDYDSEAEEGSQEMEREQRLYHFAMQIYCDFQSGVAYEDDYEWPNL